MVIDDVLNIFGKVDGEIILKQYFNLSRLDIYLNKNRILNKKEENKILEVKELYLQDYPIQYILGKWNFYGRDFYVEEGVLIPRFETEILIEKILEENHNFNNILEIGIGTGIISITLALELKESNIVGVDISDKAINLANKNKTAFNISNCKFLKSNIYEAIEPSNSFDLIVSNPPYINFEDMEKLHRKLSYEPKEALYGGDDGLNFYREIIINSKKIVTKLLFFLILIL